MTTNKPLKIAIVVHGRFYAFDLALALIDCGHDVRVFTNYPGWATERFGLHRRYVQSFTLHGGLARLGLSRPFWSLQTLHEPFLHQLFGRWAAKVLAREQWDCIHTFSGVGEEILKAPALTQTLRLLIRGSAHIRVQDRLLAEEQARTSQMIERPSAWMIAREMREYALADRIVVLSSFAKASFLSEGIPAERITVLPLGVNLAQFRASAATIAARQQRIRSGAPLRILYTGNISLQKGMYDLIRIANLIDLNCFQIRLVGDVSPDANHLLPELAHKATLIPRVSESNLPDQYAWADLYLFPTIQDGFAVVLAQAQAAGLPTLTTTNCSGPDLIIEGQTGWVLPIRSPEAFVQRLHWCDANREALATMVQATAHTYQPQGWGAIAQQYEQCWYDSHKTVQTS